MGRLKSILLVTGLVVLASCGDVSVEGLTPEIINTIKQEVIFSTDKIELIDSVHMRLLTLYTKTTIGDEVIPDAEWTYTLDMQELEKGLTFEPMRLKGRVFGTVYEFDKEGNFIDSTAVSFVYGLHKGETHPVFGKVLHDISDIKFDSRKVYGIKFGIYYRELLPTWFTITAEDSYGNDCGGNECNISLPGRNYLIPDHWPDFQMPLLCYMDISYDTGAGTANVGMVNVDFPEKPWVQIQKIFYPTHQKCLIDMNAFAENAPKDEHWKIYYLHMCGDMTSEMFSKHIVMPNDFKISDVTFNDLSPSMNFDVSKITENIGFNVACSDLFSVSIPIQNIWAVYENCMPTGPNPSLGFHITFTIMQHSNNHKDKYDLSVVMYYQNINGGTVIQ